MKLWSNIKSNVFSFAFAPLVMAVLPLLMRVRLVGRDNAQQYRRLTQTRGGLVLCNHTYYLDGTFALYALWPRRLWYTTQAENLSLPIAGQILSFWDAVGIERGKNGQKKFNDDMGKLLREGKSIVLYPEGNLRLFEKELQPFHKGAFHLAVREQVPILPIVAIPLPRRWWGLRRSMRAEVLPPVVPPAISVDDDGYEAAVEELRDKVFEMMSVRMAAEG
ncbi:hypothetical protein FACS1894129_5550 [Actinomycetota bacterium]|jgi:hypothetical protein ELI_3816|nr:hypothetical protein FACS1894129_5550 [Actinomycetota bacterium]